jgi:hypothetical protein
MYSLQALTNWITFYLARGDTYDQMLARFSANHGTPPATLWDAAFDAANHGLVNATELQTADVRSKLKNILDLPADGTGTVRVRAVVETVVGTYRTIIVTVSIQDRVGDLYSTLVAAADVPSDSVPGEVQSITIIPGVYF